MSMDLLVDIFVFFSFLLVVLMVSGSLVVCVKLSFLGLSVSSFFLMVVYFVSELDCLGFCSGFLLIMLYILLFFFNFFIWLFILMMMLDKLYFGMVCSIMVEGLVFLEVMICKMMWVWG